MAVIERPTPRESAKRRANWLVRHRFLAVGLGGIAVSIGIALVVELWGCFGSCRNEPLIIATAYTQAKPVEVEFTYFEDHGARLEVDPKSSQRPNILVFSNNVHDCRWAGTGHLVGAAGPAPQSNITAMLGYFSQPMIADMQHTYNFASAGPLRSYDVGTPGESYPIRCELSVEPLHVSFELRRLTFLHWIAGNVANESQSEHEDFHLGQPPEATDVRINDYSGRYMVRMPTHDTYLTCPDDQPPCDPGQAAFPVPEVIAAQDGIATLEWTDGRWGRWHELLFFLAGGIFGFGLAGLLEEVRPRAERRATKVST